MPENEKIFLFDKKNTAEIIDRLGAEINRCSVCKKKLKLKNIGAFLESENHQISVICDNPLCSLELRAKELDDTNDR